MRYIKITLIKRVILMNTKDTTVQWSYDFIQSFYLNNSETLTDTERAYLHYLAPYSSKYFSVLNPFLIYGGANTSLLLKKDKWFLRDGLIPLSFFFKDAPEELLDTKREFYVHKDFWFLVPMKWRKQVRFYDFESKVTFCQKNKPKQIVICGIANETLADPKEFVEQVEILSTTFSKNELEKMNVIAYFPNKRTDLWGRWKDENNFKYAKTLFEKIKLDIDFPEWDAISTTSSYEGTLYYEINSGSILKDSFVTQLLLSKGAGLLKQPKIESFFELSSTVSLSMYHQVNLYNCNYDAAPSIGNPMEDELLPYFKKIIEKGSEQRTLAEGWEKWYGTYIKKYYKSQKLF